MDDDIKSVCSRVKFYGETDRLIQKAELALGAATEWDVFDCVQRPVPGFHAETRSALRRWTS